jgi:hypothetical protein
MVKIGERISDLRENFEQYIGAIVKYSSITCTILRKEPNDVGGMVCRNESGEEMRNRILENDFWILVSYPPSYQEEETPEELPLVPMGSRITDFIENFNAYIGAKVRWGNNPGYVIVKCGNVEKRLVDVKRPTDGHTSSLNCLTGWPMSNVNYTLVEPPTLSSYLEEGEALPPIESLPNVSLQKDWQFRTYGQIGRRFAANDRDIYKLIGCWLTYDRETGSVAIDNVVQMEYGIGFTGRVEGGHHPTNGEGQGWYIGGMTLLKYPPLPSRKAKVESEEAWLKRMKDTYGELGVELPRNWRKNEFEKWKWCWIRYGISADSWNGHGKGSICVEENDGFYFSGRTILGHSSHNGNDRGWKGEDDWYLIAYPDRDLSFKPIEISPLEKQYGKIDARLSKESPRAYRRCWIKFLREKGAIRVEETWKSRADGWNFDGRTKDGHSKGSWRFNPHEWTLVSYPDADEPVKKKKREIKVTIERGVLSPEDKVKVKSLQAIIKSLSGPAALLRNVDVSIKAKVAIARKQLRDILSPGAVMKYECDGITEENIPLASDFETRKYFIAKTREALKNQRKQRRERGYDLLATRMPGHFVQQYQEKIFKVKKYPEPGKEYVGIELECYAPAKTDLKPILLPWGKYTMIGSDGSIHAEGGHVSYEIRLLIPVLEVHSVLPSILKALRQAGTKVNASCGTHVHFDMRHLSFDQVKAAYKNLFHSQNILFGIQPPSRQANNYCERNSSSDLTGNETERYKAINPCAYQKYATLELRLHAGTLDDRKLINWIALCRAIMTGPMLIQAKRKLETFAEHFSLSESLVGYIKMQMEKYDPEKPLEERQRLELESYAEPIEFGRPFSIPSPEPEAEEEESESEDVEEDEEQEEAV